MYRRPDHPVRYRFRRIRKMRLLALLAAAGLVLFGAVKLAAYGIDWLSGKRTNQELQNIYYAETAQAWPPTPAPTAAPSPAPTAVPTETVQPTLGPTPAPTAVPLLKSQRYPYNEKVQISSRFKALRKKGKYIMGWLNIRRLLDEAVVQRDNVYFLDHDALGKQNVEGALFLDSTISLKTRPYTYVIYGHNMKTGAKFGNLRNYENSTFYHNDPFITFDTMYEDGRYVVFAVGTVSTEEYGKNYMDFYAIRSAGVQERQAAIDGLIKASVHTCPIDVKVDDQLLLLVTCVEKDSDRRVVAARRIRDGETEEELKKLVSRSRKR